MKKITIALLLFISSFNLFGQAPIDFPETWDTDIWILNNWIFVSRVTYTFNTGCLPTQGLVEVNNLATNMLENSSLLTITYNANDLFDENTNALWNATTSTWEDNLKADFFYDSNNNLINTTNYDRINNDWVEKDRLVQEYLPSNLLLKSTYQNYDLSTTSWVNVTKSEYAYNADNSINIIISSVWDDVTGWLNDSRETYIYLNMLVFQIEDSDWDGGAWVNDELKTFTYDNNNFLILTLDQDWDGSNYNDAQRELRTNNADGNPTERITQDFSLGSWMNSSRDTRTYPACATLNTDDFIEEPDISFYPNPTSNRIFVKSKTEGQLSILDLTGKQIKSFEKNKFNQAIDLSQLQTGIYMFVFQTETTKTIKRIAIN